MDLPGCVAEALDRSRDLSLRQAQVAAREAALSVSRKDLYPGLGAAYTARHQPDASLLGPEGYFSYSLSLSQPVYRGEALVTTVDVRALEVDEARLNLGRTRQDVVRDVSAAYFELLRSGKVEAEAEQAVERLAAHVRDAQAFFDAGLIPKNDLLLSEVQLAQGRQDWARARLGTALARTRLNIFLLRPADQDLAVADILTYAPHNRTWEGVLALALERRAEIQAARVGVQRADKGITLADAPFRPAVTLSAQYLKQGDEPFASPYPSGPEEVKTVQASLEWHFWSWGQRDDARGQARQEWRQAEIAVDQIKDGVIVQVRQAFLALLEAEGNIGVTRKAIEQAEENYRLSQARYQAQLATSTEVLDAQTLLTQARTNYFNALYGYNRALVELDWACGVLDGGGAG
ncbi:MAG: TolC family protein [Thermodesulfobacteriota bacterium]